MSARTALLVMGAHRSGTSATAGALAQLGVPLGAGLLAPGEDNPKGYFEHREAVELDDRWLRALSRSWDDVRPMPANWQVAPASIEAAKQIDALLQAEFADADVFALKDPRMCRLLPVWLDVVRARGDRPALLFVARHPQEVAASIHKRNGLDVVVGELLWLRHMLEAAQASQGAARAAVTYDAMLADPVGTLRTAFAALDIPFPSVVDAARLQRFVHAGDRHHVARGDAPRSSFTDIANDAHAVFVDIAAGRSDWSALAPVDAALESAWAAHAELADALSEARLRATHEVESREIDLAHARTDLDAQIAWSEAAAAREEELHARIAQLGADLNAQIAWSKTALQKEEALHAQVAQVREELNAQLAWAQTAVEKENALHVALAAAAEARDAALVARNDARQQAQETRDIADALAAQVAALGDNLGEALARARGLSDEIHSLRDSLSWKVTRPLRWISRPFRSFRRSKP